MKPILFLCLVSIACTALADDIGIRVRFGLNDRQPTNWSGTVSVAPGGVALVSGWRFTTNDAVDGTKGWKASTRRVAQQRRSNNPQRQRQQQTTRTNQPLADNGVLITFTNVTEQSKVTIKTSQGDFDFQFSDAPFGKVLEQLNRAVEIERTAATLPCTNGETDDDYPSAAVAPDGTLWIAYTSYIPGIDRDQRARSYQTEPSDLSFLGKPPGGDQLWLRAVRGHDTDQPVAVTGPNRDIYKSATAVDGEGRIWVFWAENAAYKPFPNSGPPNFDIWARSFMDGKSGKPLKISDSPENDVWPVATTDSKGQIWVAWQGARDRVFRIFARHQTDKGWSDAMQVSTQSRNSWAPAIVASQTGNKIAVAWDTYDKGDYDVWVREFEDGKPAKPRPVANSADYEARPALTYDRAGALWVAWEQSGPTWGKDWGALDREGIPLYRDRQIGLAVLQNGKWMEPAGNLAKALPSVTPRRGQQNVRVPALEPEGESRRAAREAELGRDLPHNNIARLACDSGGRIWLFGRARQNDIRTPIGSLWLNWACYHEGEGWTGPILVPHSDNLLYNTPAVVAAKQGGLLLAHSADHRQDRQVRRRGQGGNAALEAENDPFENDLYVSRLSVPSNPNPNLNPSRLLPASRQPARSEASPATVEEREDVKRCRNYRAKIGGKELRILRGEFHRHTEISGDGGNDGPLEDMWRYAIDVAAMDWLGCGDHDNGGGREYPWWLTQKTTDAFLLPGAFASMFTYERSVRYPEGHRNVIFARRGVRTLPRLPKMTPESEGHAPDTQMLYKYLRLFDGVCASHTSATDMGTDWRDHDAQVEPMVEIYQGCRQNYERPGAPRCPTEKDAIGGWRPKGFVNLALLKGYRFAFQSSSDHNSTHISYALVYAEDHSREAILSAMKKRHVYAATDNIIADYRCTADGVEHMMGDEFSSGAPPALRIRLHGTAPFTNVVVIKDDVEVHTATPNEAQVDLKWTDPNPKPDVGSYYYVRGEQKDGELVWASPMWITYQPKKSQ